MLGDFQTRANADFLRWGDELVDRTSRPVHHGLKKRHFNKGSVWEIDVVRLVVTQAGPVQAYLVASPRWGADAASASQAAYNAIVRVLQDQGLAIVHERLFGSLKAKPAVMAARSAAFRARNLSADGPCTYVQGHPPGGEGLAGVIIQAGSRHHLRDRIWTIRDQGKPVGRGWRHEEATYLLLQNIQGLALGRQQVNAPPLQVKRMIQRAAEILGSQGASYCNVIRTWFYLADILGWYPRFNRARTSMYGRFGILPGQGNGCLKLPASTGIRGELSTGAAGALDLLAVMGPPESRLLVKQLSNPGQQDAFRYGSAFSRGALIRQSSHSLIQLSGTAAIDEQGRSLYPGDVRSQIDCTLDKIAILIGQEGATLADIAAACVFVKRPGDALVYQERVAARGLEALPAVVMVTDICREELLFEMDAEVVFDPSRKGCSYQEGL